MGRKVARAGKKSRLEQDKGVKIGFQTCKFNKDFTSVHEFDF